MPNMKLISISAALAILVIIIFLSVTLQRHSSTSAKPTSSRHQNLSQKTGIDDEAEMSPAEAQLGYRAHVALVMAKAHCKEPRPKLVKVGEGSERDIYRKYYPPCTWLHQCSEDFGCCFSDTLKCGPLKEDDVTRVVAYTDVQRFGKPKLGYLRITFKNHTECGCVDINPQPR